MKTHDGTGSVRYVAIAGDVAVAPVKFLAAAMTGSSAMLTEGIHSLVDTGNEFLLLFGVRLGHRNSTPDVVSNPSQVPRAHLADLAPCKSNRDDC